MTQELLGRVHRELLDVLDSINQDKIHHDGDDFHELLRDVKEALAQTQEPVAWEQFYPDIGKPRLTYPPQGIYYTQPQRTWVKLTDEEIDSFREANSEGRGAGWRFNFKGFARAIEAKLKEKNETL